MRRLVPIFLVVSGLIVPAGADAAPAARLWATINVCETAGRTTVGIRAQMPGNKTKQRMFMRFEVEWFDPKKRRFVKTGSRSRWIYAGTADFVSQQAGYNFGFENPPAGKRFRFRGVTHYEWRVYRRVKKRPAVRRWQVTERAKRVTRGGLKGVKGGKPKGRSDAICVVRGTRARADS